MPTRTEPIFVDPSRPAKLTPPEIRQVEGLRQLSEKRGWSGLQHLPEDPYKLPASREFIRFEEGVSTLLYGDSTGQQGILNHFEDPHGKARDWWKQRHRDQTDVCLFHGLGLGYLNRDILETAETGTRFFIPERDPYTFALWLASPLAEELLLHPRVTIHLTDSAEEAAKQCRDWFVQSGLSSPKIRVIANHSAFFPHPSFIRDWFEALTQIFPMMAEPLTREIFNFFPKPQNLWENWNSITARPGVELLFEKMKGTPIVVAGAGPSLESFIPVLHESQDRVLVVACDTSARTLLRNGIRVDAVVAMDSSEKNHDHLRGLSDRDFIPVFYGGAVPSLFQEYRQTAWVAGANPFPNSALIEHLPGPARFLERKGELVLNGSVGTTALDLAIKLGGGPIFLAGIDLAYPEGKDHVSGTIYDTDPGFQNRQPATYQVPDVRGKKVPTCTAFLASLYGMKYQVGLAQTEIFNLSPNGAAIPGTPDPDEGLYVFKHLFLPTGEKPSEKFRAEAKLLERSRRRPLRRKEPGNPAMAAFFDDRGRWRVHPTAEVRMEVAQINLKALAEIDSPLTGLLGQDTSVLREGRFPNGETCQWGKTEEGYPLLTFRDFQGNEIARFPRSFSPWSEIADHLVERPSGDPFIAMLGVGLGGFLESLVQQFEGTPFYLWEPNLNRVRAALGGTDWTRLFTYSNLNWCLGQSAEQFLEEVSKKESSGMKGLPVYWRPWVHPGLEVWGQKDISQFHPQWIRFYQGSQR